MTYWEFNLWYGQEWWSATVEHTGSGCGLGFYLLQLGQPFGYRNSVRSL